MDAFLRREGEVWAVQHDGRTARVRDSKGMQHLAVLLARPGVEVHALELAGTSDGRSRSSTDAAPLLDDRARSAYRERLGDLATDLDEAASYNDGERAARIQAEIDALVDQLTSATGLGGRDRGAVTDAERARVAVRRALKAALDRIADAHPSAGAHLAATIRTGVFCAYVPDPASTLRWLVGDEPAVRSAPARPPRPLVVGRAAEQSFLLEAWSVARDGRGRVVALSGEPGIGKTTLLRDLAAEVHGSGGLVIAGRCDDHLGIPYQPLIEALRALVTADGAATVSSDAGIGAGVLSSVVPEVGAPPAAGASRDTERLLLFDAVARVVHGAAGRRPVLLTVDDLHWAAAPTLALLLHALRDIDACPLLTVLTYRDTEVDDDLDGFLAGLTRTTPVERVQLRGLDADAVVELGASPDDAKRLVEHTAGNPFFVRALLDAPAGPSLPPTVLDVVHDRVRRLSSAGQRLAGLASAAGDRMGAPVAVALGGIDAVDELLRAGLLVEDGAAVAFPHALVRRAIDERTSGVRRAARHGEVARVLEEFGAPAAELLHHFAESGDGDAAVRCAIAAAGQAIRAYAFEEATAHAARGRAFADPDGAEAGTLHLLDAGARHALGDVDGASRAIESAARIAEARRDWPLLADAAIERGHVTGQVAVYDAGLAAMLRRAVDRLGATDLRRRTLVLARLAAEESASPGGDFDDAAGNAASALALARELGDDDVVLRALRSMYVVHDGPDDLLRRADIARELDALADRQHDLEVQVFAKGALATVAAELGDVASFDDALRQLHEIAQRTGIRRTSWYDLELQVVRAVIAGDLDAAEDLARRELEVGLAASVPNALRGYTMQIVVIRHEQGRAGELADAAIAMATDPTMPASITTVGAALACVGAGRLDDAAPLVHGIDLAALRRDTLFLGTICTAAEVALALGDVDVARRAYDLLRPYPGICCTIALGTISIGPTDRYLSYAARVLGDQARAEQHLVDAIALDDRMGARRWLERDRADLVALHASTTRETTTWG